jgi:xylan 1,4-beta-xylosidase
MSPQPTHSQPSEPILLTVDAGQSTPFPHLWTYFGYDECNWTTTRNGKFLLDKIRDLAERPYYVRAHFLLCTGNGLGSPKWSSTNVYTEDDAGNPVYNFRLFDEIFDTWVSRHIRPFVELGFMPKDLVMDNPERSYEDGGWAYPPKDYQKWRDLVYAIVQHCLERYGEEEVSTWYWELWNEPDIWYWKGTLEEYCKLYDYTVDGVKAAYPQARVGGPTTTHRGLEFFQGFLEHVVQGTNYATGAQGTVIDFISFHVKGGSFQPERRPTKQLSSRKQMCRSIKQHLEMIDQYPALAGLEVHLSECDPEGRAAWGRFDNYNLFWRNTAYYPSFTVSVVKHILDINERSGATVTSMLTWAFMFEGKRYFEGVRSLATNNIDKPILNLFRMFGHLGEKRLALQSTGAQDPLTYADEHGAGYPPEIDGVATMSGNCSIEVLVWSHHDDWEVTGEATVEVEVVNLPWDSDQVRCRHYRIDDQHSNAYTEWKRQGAPQDPTETQLRVIHSREGLELLEPDQVVSLFGHRFRKTIRLPINGISLLVLTPISSQKP